MPCGRRDERTLAHHVDRLLRQADGAHRVVDAATAEAGLRDGERLALTAEQRVGRDAHVVVVDERVHALAERLTGEADVALDLHARRVGRHQEHRHALVRARRRDR